VLSLNDFAAFFDGILPVHDEFALTGEAKFAEVAFEDGKVNHLVLSHDDFGFLCHIDCQFLDFRISFFRRIDLDKNLVELLICFIFWTFKLDFITSLSF
jgi:hypothetical protein